MTLHQQQVIRLHTWLEFILSKIESVEYVEATRLVASTDLPQESINLFALDSRLRGNDRTMYYGYRYFPGNPPCPLAGGTLNDENILSPPAGES